MLQPQKLSRRKSKDFFLVEATLGADFLATGLYQTRVTELSNRAAMRPSIRGLFPVPQTLSPPPMPRQGLAISFG